MWLMCHDFKRHIFIVMILHERLFKSSDYHGIQRLGLSIFKQNLAIERVLRLDNCPCPMSSAIPTALSQMPAQWLRPFRRRLPQSRNAAQAEPEYTSIRPEKQEY